MDVNMYVNQALSQSDVWTSMICSARSTGFETFLDILTAYTHDCKILNLPLDRIGITASCLKTASDFSFSLALHLSTRIAPFSDVTSAFGSIPLSRSFPSLGPSTTTALSVAVSWVLTLCSSWFVTVSDPSVLWMGEVDSVSLEWSLGISVAGFTCTALCSGLDTVSCRHDSFSVESAFPFPFCLLFLFLDDLPDEWPGFLSESKTNRNRDCHQDWTIFTTL